MQKCINQLSSHFDTVFLTKLAKYYLGLKLTDEEVGRHILDSLEIKNDFFKVHVKTIYKDKLCGTCKLLNFVDRITSIRKTLV